MKGGEIELRQDRLAPPPRGPAWEARPKLFLPDRSLIRLGAPQGSFDRHDMSSRSSQEGDAAAARSQGSQEDQPGDRLRDLTLEDRHPSASSLSEAANGDGIEGAAGGSGGGEASTLFEGEVRCMA